MSRARLLLAAGTAMLALAVVLVGLATGGTISEIVTGLVATLILGAVLDGRLAQRRAAAPVRRELARIRRDLTTVRQQVRTAAHEAHWARIHAKAGRAVIRTVDVRGERTEAALVDLRRKGSYPLRERLRDGHQIEALHNLYALIAPRQAVPPLRGWAASPDLLLLIVSLVLEHRPRLVVECGSGASTLWTAYALERLGQGRIVSLEHDAGYAERTRALLARHGLSAYARVLTAPLGPVELDGTTWQWYDTAALDGLDEIDLLVVDGPPAATGPLARYPAILLLERLSPNGAAVLDDAVREDERKIAARWAAATGLAVEHLKHLEKEALVLRRA